MISSSTFGPPYKNSATLFGRDFIVSFAAEGGDTESGKLKIYYFPEEILLLSLSCAIFIVLFLFKSFMSDNFVLEKTFR
jgi:hypothetical protein